MVEEGGTRPSPAELVRHLRHELRTPINHIIGYSEMLQEEAEDAGWDALKPDLEKVRRAGKALLTIVNDTLATADAESGRLDAQRISHDLRIPLDSVIGYGELLSEQAETLGLVDVLADVRKIQAAGRQLVGLMGAVLELADLSASSLPRAVTKPDPAEVDEPAVEPAELLVVDDNELNRDMLSRRLSRLGHRVWTAAGGAQALHILASRPVDLVLLDVMMPGVSGLDVLASMKGDAALRGVPVIMLSALDEVRDVARCLAMGAEDYLPKPFEPVILRARISACLEQKRLRDREVRYIRQIEDNERRTDELLHVILPAPIVAELKATKTVRPRTVDNVAVMFVDIVNFTPYCTGRAPAEIVANLQRLVEAYEDLAAQHGLQKIKTIGDSFMAAAGLLAPVELPVLQAVRCALGMIEAAHASGPRWEVRAGIHVGSVVAGLLGRRQYLFDLWGDTVNTAARMESYGQPGRVTLSQPAWQQVAHLSIAQSLGMVAVKGKGRQEMFRFERFLPGAEAA